MKKILIVLLAISLLAVCAFTVNAAETSGKCGDNLTWTLSDDERTLTISGTGPMYDYSEQSPPPWVSSVASLQKIIIEDGVTTIGHRAFYFQKTWAFVDVFIPSSVTYIGDRAFYLLAADCTYNYYFLGEVPELGDNPLGRSKNIYVVNWDDAAKKSLHKADGIIKDCTLKLLPLRSRPLVGLNETLSPDIFFFGLYDPHYVTRYYPRQFSVSAYDNSTYGEKSVTVTADGFTFDFTYFVTDGANHLDLIQVDFPEFPTYNGRNKTLRPIITMGSLTLKEGDHYDLKFTGSKIGIDGRVTVTGKNVAEGLEKTFYFPVLKTDISGLQISASNAAFKGEPLEPSFTLAKVDGYDVLDYYALYENNINPGTATIRTIGLDNYYGHTSGSFSIGLTGEILYLSGEYIGNVDGELSDNIPYYEKIVSPGPCQFRVECYAYHAAAFALYKFDGQDFTLIKEHTGQGNGGWETGLKHDFSYVYEDAADEGGEIYLISYSWATVEGDVYAGTTLLLFPAKVPEATSMTLEYVEGDGDFRKEFLHVYGDDGVLGEVTWESSDPSVAVVENGTVTFKRPGTVSITAQWGDLVESGIVSAPQLDLTEGFIFDWREGVGTRVIWDNRLLTEGTDYVLSVTKDGDAVTVTATGCGLFTGQLMKTFDGLDSLADPHTHSFDNVCDNTCNGCAFTRDNDHTFAQTWTKDQTHHWHACTGCGLRKDEAQHALSPADDTLCTVCGPLHTPGDLDGNYTVNEDDAIYLLQHILLPDFFPITQHADYSGDNRLDEDDAIYLLQHVLLPDYFPLS